MISKNFKMLKKNKKYQFKVRAYCANGYDFVNGKTINWTDWSAVRTVKTKKQQRSQPLFQRCRRCRRPRNLRAAAPFSARYDIRQTE